MSTGADAPSIHAFLMECHRISTRARFIIDTIPNADLDAAERAVTQLDAIRYLLYQLHDQIADAEQLSQYVDELLGPLENFLSNPPPHPSDFVPRVYQPKDLKHGPTYLYDVI
ncbi:hypothetical protein BDZ89DRAFT_1134755 [Hymenopellis radicata]|nr:hypothetical protein BDZ89DRAFT_1134755 [Hymenopellis radicata]